MIMRITILRRKVHTCRFLQNWGLNISLGVLGGGEIINNSNDNTFCRLQKSLKSISVKKYFSGKRSSIYLR